jgi:hypothetical protein
VTLLGREVLMVGSCFWGLDALFWPWSFLGSIRLATHKECCKNSLESQADVSLGRVTAALERHKSPCLCLCREYFIGYTKGVQPTISQISYLDYILIAALAYQLLQRPHHIAYDLLESPWKCLSICPAFLVTSIVYFEWTQFHGGKVRLRFYLYGNKTS